MLNVVLASIPGRVFAFITVRRTTVCLTVIKAKTRPGIEAKVVRAGCEGGCSQSSVR